MDGLWYKYDACASCGAPAGKPCKGQRRKDNAPIKAAHKGRPLRGKKED